MARQSSGWGAMAISMLVGAGTGLLGGEFVSPTGASLWRMFVSLLLSPISIVVGAQATTIEVMRAPLEVGGVLFWPVLVGLTVLWRRGRSPFLLLAIAMWTFQAFFQITRRLEVLLSV